MKAAGSLGNASMPVVVKCSDKRERQAMKFKEIKIGDSASFSKTISEGDVYLFAGISGDLNPAHVNKMAAEQGIFKKQVVHGMLAASLISSVLGMQLPGPGTIYMGQDLRFVKPVYFGDTITATVTVETIDYKRKMITLRTICTNEKEELVIEGHANVRPPSSIKI